jgi:Ca2+-transporting ATPase
MIFIKFFCSNIVVQAYKLKKQRRGLFMWHTLSAYEVARKLKTNITNGLTNEEAKERLNKNGYNKLEEKKKENIIIKFLKQFNDFMIIILIIASIVSAVMAYLEGTGDYMDSCFIIAIVVFNAIMGLVQESKAEKSLEALKKMSAPIAKVRRNGKIITVPSEELIVRRYCNIRSRKLCASRLQVNKKL